jgi:phosphoribosyl 1,2-cyclic phosphodiesterase
MDRHLKRHTKPMARLRVLASGSGGNCSLLVTADGHRILIDAGLSPRRTRQRLDENDLQLSDIDAVLLTHLDSDHFNTGWRNTLPESIRLCLHQRHANHASTIGFHHPNTHVFTDPFDLFDSVHVDPLLLSHDQLGVTAFRLTFAGNGEPPAHLGFATDLGKVSPRLIERFAGVDVLAIESNYCPRMQTQSDRPEFLKRRIMGGAGHLSNQESKQAVEAIAPREHVVFLHLSRQCNRPDLVADLHAHEHYAFTIAEQFNPTRWVSIGSHAACTDGLAPHHSLGT